MDNLQEMREAQKRTNSHRRKKLFVNTVLIATVLVFIICSIMLCLKQKKLNVPLDTKDTVVTEPTLTSDSIQATIMPTQEVIPTPTSIPTELPIERRGVHDPIPDNIKNVMNGKSMPQNACVTFDDLAYLTIPHYDFNYNVVVGHLVVHKDLADEVLDIFAELFDVKYPIERMELVDHYNADDFLSIEYNNTSAFNYRESTDGSGRLSKHAFGRAIDINPQINPYVKANGVGAHKNAKEYWSRDISLWSSDIAKAAYIGKDTNIYKIFVDKYGWEWGGSWSSYKDYQHFQKKGSAK